MALLDVHVTSSQIGDDAYAVAVLGELDAYGAERVKVRLAHLLEEDVRIILVDLSGASFIDSSGLAVLLTTAQALRSAGGRLVIVASNPHILRVLQLVDPDERVHVEHSLVEAVSYVVDQRLAV